MSHHAQVNGWHFFFKFRIKMIKLKRDLQQRKYPTGRLFILNLGWAVSNKKNIYSLFF